MSEKHTSLADLHSENGIAENNGDMERNDSWENQNAMKVPQRSNSMPEAMRRYLGQTPDEEGVVVYSRSRE
ncbi:uncharacterized protein H6S33_002004 [Morchella sextelata]|uniref:uncharacterized protein n=1 Tax=Morchella sextelata TaxID=1174677 RepID=UPI001D05682B|nr:uncharacterized protein H6S33_002004 [Morchella sextelata]KAH0607952.1 hypothetical protein H6S33_002004 [Morchella sextelata]